MAAITTAAIGAGTAIYSAKQSSKAQKQATQQAAEATAAADPYAAYRDDAAKRLDALMKDPSSIADSATYKMRQQAAERIMAAQGYSGSGNAILAATDAAARSYQQEFDNLALLSGAGVGVQTAAGAAASGNALINDARNTKLSAYAGVANNLTNLADKVFNRPIRTA